MPLPDPSGRAILNPDNISQYSVSTGAKQFNMGAGKVQKNARGDTTTLFTFSFPDWTAGKTCQLNFFLNKQAALSGSRTFDVFSSLAPATTSAVTWPNGNLRDQQLGRMTAVKGGDATVSTDAPNKLSFPCPQGQLLGGELVGVNDQVNIEWVQNVAGPYIVVV